MSCCRDYAQALASLRASCLPRLLSEPPPPPELALSAPADEVDERRRDRTLRLSQLLLLALVALAQPLAGTLLAVLAHTRADAVGGEEGGGGALQGEQALALEAQLLLEGLVRAWTRRRGPLWALAAAVNARFTPALLMARALQAGNVGCAALLLQAAGRWRQALRLQLEELGAAAQKGGGEAQPALLAGALVRLVRTHVLARPPGESLGLPERRAMMEEVLGAWAALGCPTEPLEDACWGAQPAASWETHVLAALLMDLVVVGTGMCRSWCTCYQL
jgi:hypothetical protein